MATDFFDFLGGGDWALMEHSDAATPNSPISNSLTPNR